jgi:hypothetical protein
MKTKWYFYEQYENLVSCVINSGRHLNSPKFSKYVYNYLYGLLNQISRYNKLECFKQTSFRVKEEHTSVEHPTREHPTVVHPTVELPTVEHPTVEYPTAEHPTVEHPTVEHPTMEHPTAPCMIANIKLGLYWLP